jgi:hypothetical protein
LTADQNRVQTGILEEEERIIYRIKWKNFINKGFYLNNSEQIFNFVIIFCEGWGKATKKKGCLRASSKK